MRLRPIRPTARLPTLWLQHPELAPPRRRANAAFVAGATVAGLHTRFPVHPECNARTRRGTRSKAPKVAGANRCRHHGGGRMLLRRARETLATTRSRAIMEKCLWYLAEGEPQSNSTASEGWRTPVGASGSGSTTCYRIHLPSICAKAGQRLIWSQGCIAPGDKVRPYRPQDVTCAAGAFLRSMSSGQPLRLRFEAFASELQADEHERLKAAAIIGLRTAGRTG